VDRLLACDGSEVEACSIMLEDVKVSSLRKINAGNGYADEVAFRFAKITETFVDGNLQHSDSWREGR
jgi:type VI protein secretion system component Hcp